MDICTIVTAFELLIRENTHANVHTCVLTWLSNVNIHMAFKDQLAYDRFLKSSPLADGFISYIALLLFAFLLKSHICHQKNP